MTQASEASGKVRRPAGWYFHEPYAFPVQFDGADKVLLGAVWIKLCAQGIRELRGPLVVAAEAFLEQHRDREPTKLSEAVKAVYDAGGKGWDDVDDPDELLSRDREPERGEQDQLSKVLAAGDESLKERLRKIKEAVIQGCVAAAHGKPLHAVAETGYEPRSYQADAWEHGWGRFTHDQPPPPNVEQKDLPDRWGHWNREGHVDIWAYLWDGVLLWRAIEDDGSGIIASNGARGVVSELPRGNWRKATAQSERKELERLRAAVNEYLDVYECLTSGNPLKSICLGMPVRDLLYAAVPDRERPAECIPDGWIDPTIAAGQRIAYLESQLTTAAETIAALTADRERLQREAGEQAAKMGELSARAKELDQAHLERDKSPHCSIAWSAAESIKNLSASITAARRENERLKREMADRLLGFRELLKLPCAAIDDIGRRDDDDSTLTLSVAEARELLALLNEEVTANHREGE